MSTTLLETGEETGGWIIRKTFVMLEPAKNIAAQHYDDLTLQRVVMMMNGLYQTRPCPGIFQVSRALSSHKVSFLFKSVSSPASHFQFCVMETEMASSGPICLQMELIDLRHNQHKSGKWLRDPPIFLLLFVLVESWWGNLKSFIRLGSEWETGLSGPNTFLSTDWHIVT